IRKWRAHDDVQGASSGELGLGRAFSARADTLEIPRELASRGTVGNCGKCIREVLSARSRGSAFYRFHKNFSRGRFGEHAKADENVGCQFFRIVQMFSVSGIGQKLSALFG